MRPSIIIAVALLGTAGTPAAAVEPLGFSAGVRTGLGIPAGSAFLDPVTGQAVSFSTYGSPSIPIQVDAGLRFASHHLVGAYYQYGIAVLGTLACGSGWTCTGGGSRLGVQYAYTFSPDEDTVWLGAGSGWEWAQIGHPYGSATGDLSLDGWEILNVQVGYDWTLGRIFRLGPYASASIAEFSSYRASSGLGSTSGSIANRAIHSWINLGIRGLLEL